MRPFFKGVLVSHLKDKYIPGTVTNDFRIALTWKERIGSNKSKGAAKHVTHGKACIIEVLYDGEIHDHTNFQVAGVAEHKRVNCWTSAAKDKAQINTVCTYRILSDEEIDKRFTL